MSGTIPTELGELQGLENLDLSKRLSDYITTFIPVKRLLLTWIFVLFLGNYTVLVDDEAKREIGTIPTELGQLTFWKHVVLSKCILSNQFEKKSHIIIVSSCYCFNHIK